MNSGLLLHFDYEINSKYIWACRGRDRMVIGFTTTYAISAYHH
jgi:hypothetical protein